MPDILASYFSNRTTLELTRDFIDIFIVYSIVYRLLLVVRGTRAMQVAAGLAIIALLYVVAQVLGLVAIETLVGSLLQSIILVIVVVFQSDIRRALQRVGSRAIFGHLSTSQETEVIDAVVEAARELARHRIGALITFEQDANLDEFVGQNKGIDLDAKVSPELLVSLFIPEGTNKLHDGSVVIRSLRIAKAGVFFPMPEGRVFDASFGSRHRAAIGITEETDAVVIVVSEERGTLSFCFNGNIASDLQASQLKEMLLSIMNPKVRKESRKTSRQRISTEAPPPSERVTLQPTGTPDTKTPLPAAAAETSQPAPLRRTVLPQDPAPGERFSSAPPPPLSERPSSPESRPGNAPPPLRKSVPRVEAPVEDRSEPPPPLRKSAPRVEPPPEEHSEVPPPLEPTARPMPKGEVQLVQDLDEIDDSEEKPRSTS